MNPLIIKFNPDAIDPVDGMTVVFAAYFFEYKINVQIRFNSTLFFDVK
jgi:hypothetical protein